MKNILCIVGSARKGRVAGAITEYIQAITADDATVSVSVADLAALNLPFFNNERTPSDPEYVATDDTVLAWGKLVADADAVIFITPEYNHSLSGIQKNAIDSLYKEWNDKPTGVVAYGWYGGENALVTFKEVATVVKFDLKGEPVQLYFTKDVAPDGSIMQPLEVKEKIQALLEVL